MRVYEVVTVGETVIEAFVCELFHINVPPVGEGVAVTVALCPAQMVEEETLTVGVGFTVRVLVAVAVQPLEV